MGWPVSYIGLLYACISSMSVDIGLMRTDFGQMPCPYDREGVYLHCEEAYRTIMSIAIGRMSVYYDREEVYSRREEAYRTLMPIDIGRILIYYDCEEASSPCK